MWIEQPVQSLNPVNPLGFNAWPEQTFAPCPRPSNLEFVRSSLDDALSVAVKLGAVQ